MGEIDDIRYALVRTSAARRAGRGDRQYFEWLANNYGKELEQLAGRRDHHDSGVIAPAEQQLAGGKLVAIPGKIKDAAQNVANAFRTFERTIGSGPRYKCRMDWLENTGTGRSTCPVPWNDVRNIGEDQASPGKHLDSASEQMEGIEPPGDVGGARQQS